MTTTTTTKREQAQRLVTSLPTDLLVDSFYTNAVQMTAARGTAAYGTQMLVHMWISDEIATRLGNEKLEEMENTAFGEIA